MRIISILIFLLLSVHIFAQQDVDEFYKPTDKDIRMGFTLGLNYNIIQLEKSDWSNLPNVTDSLNSISTKNTLGLSIGMLFNQKIADYFQIRIYPNLFFYCNTINYDTKYSYKESVSLRNSVLNAPIQFNFMPLKNNREIQLFLGGKYAYIFGNADYESTLYFETKKVNLYVEFGLGYQYEYDDASIFAEIKYSLGLNNLMPEEGNSIYVSSISSIKFNTITLTISYF